MDDLRIVLFGHDIPKWELIKIIENAGKFKQDPKNNPGTQQYQCQKYSRSINDKHVVIIDTPGVDTGGNDKEKVLEEIKWSVAVADPGPHMFLFVEIINNSLSDDKFKKKLSDKLGALEDFQKTFGEQANDFTMMVFITDGENNIKPFRELTYPFNHRYFIFNIKDDEQQQESQVTELLEKIAQMGGEASARFYTPKMVWEAEKALKQEEQKQEEEKQKQEEKKQKQDEEKQKQDEEKQRQEEETWGKIRDKFLVIGAQVGATIGFWLSFYIFNEDPSSAVGGVGSIVGVIIVAVSYLVFHHFKFNPNTARIKQFSSPCTDAGGASKRQLSTAYGEAHLHSSKLDTVVYVTPEAAGGKGTGKQAGETC